ncbi:hypothetical protein G4B88_016071 [Cannabis sativa]|uniref:Uncharacterized protein n=1 Tax=Cannabis sativa TaxID=3483 RepID=A0A7J6F033_CANSA|nr:hypothetical protein G4B88_016071 [Cannabis sativa]
MGVGISLRVAVQARTVLALAEEPGLVCTGVASVTLAALIKDTLRGMACVSVKWTDFEIVETRTPGEWFLSGQRNGFPGQKDEE